MGWPKEKQQVAILLGTLLLPLVAIFISIFLPKILR